MTKKETKEEEEELANDDAKAEKPQGMILDEEKNEGIQTGADGKKKEPEEKSKKLNFLKDPKKRLIFIITLGLVFILLFGVGLYFLLWENASPKTQTSEQKKTEESTKAELFESPLTGVLMDKTLAEKHPLAVIVENHPDARPQSGLGAADIVYEAIVEGGITRFMAVYGSKESEKVGPARSARTFFVDWAHGYNAFLAHVGGNMDALDKIKAERTPDLDQFAYPSSYWREYSAGLATEHTMYTNTIKLREQAAKNGYSTANTFNLWKFKDDPSDKTVLPETQEVAVNFSSAQYNVSFAYDKATNSYKRSMAGKAHNDKLTKEQINPKNVIVMTVNRKPVVTRINEAGYLMTTVGTGKAKILIDGKAIEGTWKKQSASDRELFYDENGQEVTFNRGTFWICVIPPESTVTIK